MKLKCNEIKSVKKQLKFYSDFGVVRQPIAATPEKLICITIITVYY